MGLVTVSSTPQLVTVMGLNVSFSVLDFVPEEHATSDNASAVLAISDAIFFIQLFYHSIYRKTI